MIVHVIFGGVIVAKDVLSKEITVSGKLEENGISAGTNSRFLVSIDRLAGSAADWVNLLFEPGNSKRRALSDAEVKIIEAAATAAAGALKADPDKAMRVLTSTLSSGARKQAAKDAVLTEALEDLREDPPTKPQTKDETPLSEEFLSRLERYAEDATTEELQKRWGRVLASEVRVPGTFSRKVLRVVDELDAGIAQIFEGVCIHRIGNALPRALTGKLPYNTTAALVTADLLTEPSITGQRRLSSAVADSGGTSLWVAYLGSFALGFSSDVDVLGVDDGEAAVTNTRDPGPSIPIYLLTAAGAALASILKNDEEANIHRLAQLAANQLAVGEVRVYRQRDNAAHLIGTVAAARQA